MRHAALVFALAVASCRDREAPRPPSMEDAAVEVAPPAHVDGGVVTMVEPACEGAKLGLFDAVIHPRCAVTDEEWNAAQEKGGVVQEAQAAGDDVDFAIVNRGTTLVSIPLRFDDRHPERAFEVVAEMLIDGGGVYTLAPPKLTLPESDAGVHVHSARIRLPPGGRAVARLVLDRHPRERLDRHVDAGTALPTGPVRLHIGQTMSPLDMGDPASLK